MSNERRKGRHERFLARVESGNEPPRPLTAFESALIDLKAKYGEAWLFGRLDESWPNESWPNDADRQLVREYLQPPIAVDPAAKKAKSHAGRPTGTGFEPEDRPIVEKMRTAIETGRAKSWADAAKMYSSEVPGASVESKEKRLSRLAVRLYGRLHGEEKGAK